MAVIKDVLALRFFALSFNLAAFFINYH